MLTKDQLDAALTEIENGATSDATLTTVRWLAIRYDRVAALLDDKSDSPFVFKAELRRALEG